MDLEPLLAIFLIWYFRKTLRPLPSGAYLVKPFTFLLYGAGLLLLCDIIFRIEHVSVWIWHMLLLALSALVYRNRDLYILRPLMLAFIPIILLGIIESTQYWWNVQWIRKAEGYMAFAYVIAVTWIIAMLIMFWRQRKVQLREQKIRLAEEEKNRIMAARKAELEELVDQRTAELIGQKQELQQAIVNLQATQDQLIQSEKMASLGELTAGIAHEIQNPLNFVNNFSELSAELIDEMEHELSKGNTADARLLAADIKQNLQKISYHGKRADAIVKGMLQHSRRSTGQKELVDINALADEYLRLSYHGLRARDKTFNALLQTEFDDSLGKVKVIPQDMGRVLLNLFTNAFYSVSKKKKLNDPAYEPVVYVCTRLISTAPSSKSAVKKKCVEICVKDNGMGIPGQVLDKIYQPFFTTKPTGEGTGLGLSLSYEIIKAHQGELTVNTREGEFAEFIIHLPLEEN